MLQNRKFYFFSLLHLAVFFLFAIALTVLGLTVKQVQAPKDIRNYAYSATQTAPATLQDYWSGNAEWRSFRTLSVNQTNPDIYADGSKVKAIGNIWYLFYRKVSQAPSGQCSGTGGVQIALLVRKSTDQGASWSGPTTVFTPDATRCMITDGDFYYNAKQNKWRSLQQCYIQGSGWDGCYFERSGQDPMGEFTEPLQNPVIKGGASRDLWKNICTNATKDCYLQAGGNNVSDAGTFEIFRYDGVYYYIGFHGYDGVRGYRGIAKTADFKTYIAGNPNKNVPADAILDKNDATNWREAWQGGGSIGFGNASILYQNSYYYMLAEAADMNLACSNNQNWDIGIFRSKSLTNTTWQQYPKGNPIFYSTKKPYKNGTTQPCSPAYAQFLQDPLTHEIFLYFGRTNTENWNDYGLHIYKLVRSVNILQNADLWTCRVDPWKTTSGSSQVTAIAVSRDTDDSSDGNCYLAASCNGSSCQGDQSIYQEASVGSISNRTVTFGGKFASAQGTGSADLVLWQFGPSGIIRSDSIPVSLGTAYSEFSKTITLDPAATTVRHQLYMTSPIAYKADEMYIRY